MQDVQDRYASTEDAAEAAASKADAMLVQLFGIMGTVQGTAADAAPAVQCAAAEAVARKWLGAPQHAATEDAAATTQLLAALQAASAHYDSVSQLSGTAALAVALNPQIPPAALQPWVQSLARHTRCWPGAYAALRNMAVNARLVVADMLPAQTWTAIVQDLLAVDRWILAGCPVGGLQSSSCIWPAVYQSPEGIQVRTDATGQQAVQDSASTCVGPVLGLDAVNYCAARCDLRCLQDTWSAVCALQEVTPPLLHSYARASSFPMQCLLLLLVVLLLVVQVPLGRYPSSEAAQQAVRIYERSMALAHYLDDPETGGQ
jgi:hypothetical protein